MIFLCACGLNKVFSQPEVVLVDRETSNVSCVFIGDSKPNENYVNHMDVKKKEVFLQRV